MWYGEFINFIPSIVDSATSKCCRSCSVYPRNIITLRQREYFAERVYVQCKSCVVDMYSVEV